jgi:hypothetical protein
MVFHLDDEFNKLQREFYEQYAKEFSTDEENKFVYTEIFNLYVI